jgi:putative holliday junction resolvase
MKIVALDIGDVWTGIALSDALAILARPYKTVKTDDLAESLGKIIQEHCVITIVVGYPQTLQGKVSQQTKKTEIIKESLKEKLPDIAWVWWDERLSSKQASQLRHARTKEEKIQAHSIAAAFILRGYLDFLGMQQSAYK